MIHSIERIAANIQGCFSRDRAPILSIDPGDSIRCATFDAGWGMDPFAADVFHSTIRPQDRVDPVNDRNHCLIGPISIRGARPGMTLRVDVIRLVPEDVAWTWVGVDLAFSRDVGIQQNLHTAWRIENGVATSHDGFRVRTSPFLGVMGVCPGERGVHSTIPPRRVGGNIDCKSLIAGSSLFLPIEVEGALFAFGDGHAAQGDGETCGTAIECGFKEVELKFSLIDDLPLDWPQAKVPGGYITFGFDADLNRATVIALGGMLDHLVRTMNISRSQAHALASVAVDLRITQIANGVLGVHAFLPDGAFV